MHQQDGPVTLAGISERQHISLSYLEQLFGKLRRYGLVTSVRGPGGGYCLGRESAEISASDIIRAVDEVLGCDEANCREEYICITHKLWSKLTNRMYEYLDGISLEDLVKEQHPDAVAVLRDQRPARRPAKRSEVMAVA